MDKALIARAFNEWMRRYTENPEQFEREWQTVNDFSPLGRTSKSRPTATSAQPTLRGSSPSWPSQCDVCVPVRQAG